jgi:nitroimidazol reductase NimA-like FMN-containing flavoprotein (pyridoxamine 5'-phosphate oxidase superfamily)
MRRRDREVTDINDLLSIVEECRICHLGLIDDKGMYIVPLNYGYEYINQRLNLYFHSAHVGRKIDAIINNPNVCIEMDCDHRLIEGEKACDYSFGFKSIIGNGKASIVSDYNEKLKGLSLLMKHETQREFEFDEKMINQVSVIKVEVTEFTGKYHK